MDVVKLGILHPMSMGPQGGTAPCQTNANQRKQGVPVEADQGILAHGEPIMRSLIKLLVVLLICLVGIGFYWGWFSLSNPGQDTEAPMAVTRIPIPPWAKT